MKNVLIGGIGNVLLGDDGVGPYVARLLDAHYEFDEGVEIVDLGTPALDLMDQISGRDAVILIDSVATNAAPGTVVLYRKAEIMRHTPSVRMDPHSPALVDTLLSADMFGVAPTDLLLVGIAVESYDTGCALSDAVNRSVSGVIAEILRELDRVGVGYTRRKQSIESGIWWAGGDQRASAWRMWRSAQFFNQTTGKMCPSLRKSESLVTSVAFCSIASAAAKLST